MNFIWITTQFEGFHKYTNAPENVKFLRNEHRHIFKVKVWIEVFHNNRELEFFQFKKFVESLIDKNLNNMSCEMIATLLASKIKTKYKSRKLKIEVSEDGENGCENEY